MGRTGRSGAYVSAKVGHAGERTSATVVMTFIVVSALISFYDLHLLATFLAR